MSAEYSENPSMFKNNPLGFILSILLIPAFGVGVLILLAWYLQTKATRLEISGDDVILEKGLLSKSRTEVNVTTIRTIKVHQSFFNRIFGVGRIELYTAGDAPELVASGMPDPHTFRDIVKDRQNQKDTPVT